MIAWTKVFKVDCSQQKIGAWMLAIGALLSPPRYGEYVPDRLLSHVPILATKLPVIGNYRKGCGE